MIAKHGLEMWHKTVRNMSAEALDALLADDVVFHSPVVHTPQVGRDLTRLYLLAAFNVFPATGGADAAPSAKKPETKFKYVREVVGEKDAILEFTTEIEGILVNGVDMITWNDDGKINEFKVMIRPLKAIQKVHAQMGAMLQSMKPA
jgi:hypothetical protein